MRYLLLLLLVTSCSSYPKKNIGIIHDYIITAATKSCADHGGLHYIVAINHINGRGARFSSGEYEYPCVDKYQFRCQDDTLSTFNDEVSWCFISIIQVEETIGNKDYVGE
jgi:hypothetical protein